MFRLTRLGLPQMIVGTALLAGIAALLGWLWWPAAFIVLPVFIWLLAFFRDPERQIPNQSDAMVSPADGVISDVIEIEHDELIGGPAVRVGIFLSIFNVHINRSPCDARVLDIRYTKGKFVSALRFAEASAQNEANTLILGDPNTGEPIAVVKQIAGLIARRIVCTVAKSQTISRGQRFGMIKFGSRTELTIARRLDPKVQVKVGQAIRGGCDIIAMLGRPIAAGSSAAGAPGEASA